MEMEIEEMGRRWEIGEGHSVSSREVVGWVVGLLIGRFGWFWIQ